MKQIIKKVITYSGEYAQQRNDGETEWISVHLWVTDEYELFPAQSFAFWMNVDKFRALDQSVAEKFEDGLIWGQETVMCQMWQSLLDSYGPLKTACIEFDEDYVLIKLTSKYLQAVEKRGHYVVSRITSFAYFESAPFTGNYGDQKKRCLTQWMPYKEYMEKKAALVAQYMPTTQKNDNSATELEHVDLGD